MDRNEITMGDVVAKQALQAVNLRSTSSFRSFLLTFTRSLIIVDELCEYGLLRMTVEYVV